MDKLVNGGGPHERANVDQWRPGLLELGARHKEVHKRVSKVLLLDR